jgi:hypothetical protein
VAQVLPHAAERPAAPRRTRAPDRRRGAAPLGLFYDVVYPLLLVPGLVAIRGAAPPARRVVGAALLAGAALLVLRYAAPVVFRDAKEVELLAGAGGGPRGGRRGLALTRRGPVPRAAAVLGLVAPPAGALSRAALAYADRFVRRGPLATPASPRR